MYALVSLHARGCARHDETRAFPIYMRILVHEFAHVYNVFLAAFGSKLFESFIRRDSLLTRWEKLDAGEAQWNVGARITGAFSMSVDQKNGKQSRSRAQECWKFEFWIAASSYWYCAISAGMSDSKQICVLNWIGSATINFCVLLKKKKLILMLNIFLQKFLKNIRIVK